MAFHVNRVLYCTDGSAVSWKAFPAAVEAARRFDADLAVFSAISEPYYLASLDSGGRYMEIMTEVEPQLRMRIEEEIALRREELGPIKVTVELRRTNKSPPQAILSYADEVHADLIVLATHGAGFWMHMMMGSTAEHVVRLSKVPVLTVRASDEAE